MKVFTLKKELAKDLPAVLTSTMRPADFKWPLADVMKLSRASDDLAEQIAESGYADLVKEVKEKEAEILKVPNKEIASIREKYTKETDEEKKKAINLELQVLVAAINDKYSEKLKENSAKLIEANKEDIDLTLSDDKFSIVEKFIDDYGKDVIATVKALVTIKEALENKVEEE